MVGFSISLCMIVKNEERDLPFCLDSVKTIVDEMIVVDTGSTDSTISIAKSFGARVVQHEWPGDFSTARNISLDSAKMDWILVLDADEKLDSSVSQRLKPFLSQTKASGLRMIQRNLYPPGDLVRYHDIPITRLWRNDPRVRYEGLIHESVVDSISRTRGSIQNTDFVIWHSGYTRSTVQGGSSRAQRNLELLQKMLETNPDDAYVNYQYGITCKQLGKNEEAKKFLLKTLELEASTLTSAIMSEILMKLAQIESSQNNNSACIKYAEKSLSYDPANVVSLYLAALGYMAQGEIKKAYSFFLRIRQDHVNLVNDLEQLDTVLDYCRSVLGNEINT